MLFVIGFALAAPLIGGGLYSLSARRQMLLNGEGALDCLRSVRTFEKAFAAANGGLYAPPFCILHPVECGAQSPATSVTRPACLTRALSDQPEVLTYVSVGGHHGRFLSPGGPSALSSTFVMTLEPSAPGKTGMQLVGLDETGRICVVGVRRDRQSLLDRTGHLRTDCDSTE